MWLALSSGECASSQKVVIEPISRCVRADAVFCEDVPETGASSGSRATGHRRIVLRGQFGQASDVRLLNDCFPRGITLHHVKSRGRVEWKQEQRDALRDLLDKANGRRGSRLLSLPDVERCVDTALQRELGYAWASAGDAPDARGSTTICLAVVEDEYVTVGVAAAHGAATPANGWSDIHDWDRYREASNAAPCHAWARKKGPDRLTLTLTSPRPSDTATQHDLLAAVLADPEADAPRLVYADWLTERGDPRGIFISLQCELARGTSRVAEVEAEAKTLLDSHGAQWLEGVNPGEVTVRFRRGFVERAEVRGAEALADLTPFFEREPVTQLVHLAERRVIDAELFANSNWVDRLRTLEFRSSHSASPVSLKLERLNQLLESRYLRRLTRLVFHGQRLGDQGLLRLVAQGPTVLPAIESLAVEADTIGSDAIATFAESRWSARLKELSFSDNPIAVEGAYALAEARSPGVLEKLSLNGCQVGNAGAVAIAGAARFKTLKSLSLERNRITLSGLNALLQSKSLAGIEKLELAGNPIGAIAKSRLRQRFGS